jgi:hypothetical protein
MARLPFRREEAAFLNPQTSLNDFEQLAVAAVSERG